MPTPKWMYPVYSKTQIKYLISLWVLVFLPIFSILICLVLARLGFFGYLPNIEEIGKTKNNLATEIYTSDGVLLGKYFNENRQDINFEEISPFVLSALIATEDERFYEHAGIDLISILRAIGGLGKAGGGSTITQQLAKMLFTREISASKIKRIRDKFKEWIIAVELEKIHTKEEILTMYLNRFDFLFNAVGLKSASKIYFNKTPLELNEIEAAVLVAMAKNPRIYNPILYPEKSNERKNIVLQQWYNNSKKNNPALLVPLNEEKMEELKKQYVLVQFNKDSHNEGLAPHFREILRKELHDFFDQKDPSGNFLYANSQKEPYDIYRDGLKIYTTLDSRIQQNAEWALEEHLKTQLQSDFYKDIRNRKNWPYDDNTDTEVVKNKIWTEIKKTERYQMMAGLLCPKCHRPASYIEEAPQEYICHGEAEPYAFKKYSEKDILKELSKPIPMKIFSWSSPNREIDTLLSTLDSIKYYKSILQAGLIAISPQNGQVKAWVGGHNFKFFKYDHVKTTKRQAGSTFKPFIYATLLRDKSEITPVTEIIDKEYCIDVQPNGEWMSWCPKSDGHVYTYKPISLKQGLANSLNSVTTWAMSQTTPLAIIKLLREMGVNTKKMSAVPSIALGVFDVNLIETTAAFATFANGGNYIKPIYISKIEDRNGNLIYKTPVESRTVLDEKTTFNILDMLKGVIKGGYDKNGERYLGTGIRLLSAGSEQRPYTGMPAGLALAGKTGTTQSNSDGWFVGLTPDLVTGIWVGAEDRNVRFANTYFGQGANTGLPIFGYFTKKNFATPGLNFSLTDFEISYKYLPADSQYGKKKSGEVLFDENLFD